LAAGVVPASVRHILRQNSLISGTSIPSRAQIKNRKSSLKQYSQNWSIDTLGDLRRFLSLKTISCLEQFDKIPNEKDIIVLDIFEIDQSIGFVFTSKALVQYIPQLRGEQEKGFSMECDGTYKLVVTGWVLQVLGTHIVRRASFETSTSSRRDEEYFHSSRPFLFMFSKTESGYAIQKLLQVYKKVCAEFLNIPSSIACATMDHSDAIRKAFLDEMTITSDSILDCWAHIARKVTENRGHIRGDGETKEIFLKQALEDLSVCHLSRSRSIFNLLTTLLINKWTVDGQKVFADWFKKVYLNKWGWWYVTASNIPGVLPNNNPMESYNKLIKQSHVCGKPVSFTELVNTTIPNILDMSLDLYSSNRGRQDRDIRNQGEEIIYMFVNNFFPIGVLEKAYLFIISPSTCYARAGPDIRANEYSLYVNSKSDLMFQLTQQRIDLFYCAKYFDENIIVAEDINDGNDDETTVMSWFSQKCDELNQNNPSRFIPKSFEEAEMMCNSIHEVTKSSTADQHMPYTYSCDCKGFMHSGYVCSHILLAYHLDENFPQCCLREAMRTIPKVKKRGRPPRRTPPLITDYTSSATQGSLSISLCPSDTIFIDIHNTGVLINFNHHKKTWFVQFDHSSSNMECQFCSSCSLHQGRLHLLLSEAEAMEGRRRMLARIHAPLETLDHFTNVREPFPNSPEKTR